MQRKIPLISDGTDRYSNVLVSATGLQALLKDGPKSKNPARFYLNQLLEIVFTGDELGAEGKPSEKLDGHKLAAIKGNQYMHCCESGYCYVKSDLLNVNVCAYKSSEHVHQFACPIVRDK